MNALYEACASRFDPIAKIITIGPFIKMLVNRIILVLDSIANDVA
jgi:hypothetical protein